jgi:hypothetical protein
MYYIQAVMGSALLFESLKYPASTAYLVLENDVYSPLLFQDCQHHRTI